MVATVLPLGYAFEKTISFITPEHLHLVISQCT